MKRLNILFTAWVSLLLPLLLSGGGARGQAVRPTDWTTGNIGSPTAGGAGSSTGAGDGWIDNAGGVATAGAGGKLVLTTGASDPLSGHDYLLRPAFESLTDTKITVRCRLADGAGSRYIVLRHTGSGTEYLIGYDPSATSLYIFRDVGSAVTALSQRVQSAPPDSDVLRLTASATGAVPVALSLSLYDETTGAMLGAISASDTSPPTALQGPGQAGIIAGATSSATGFLSAQIIDLAPRLEQRLAFGRAQPSPVIALGTTYDGTQADALAAPTVARSLAGAGWVLKCDAWNVATGKWYNLAFASPDLLTWAYVTGSKQSPTSSNYIRGNGGLLTAMSRYNFAYNSYPQATPTGAGIYLDTSTDLLTWTPTNSGSPVISPGAAGSGDSDGCYDPSLTLNPVTGLYECWYTGQDSAIAGRSILWATSTDLLTWRKQGIAFGVADAPFAAGNLGEPSVNYVGGDRYVTFDAGRIVGARSTGLAYDKGSKGVYSFTPLAHSPQSGNPWESANVFDLALVGLLDRQDGRGAQLWGLYAGSPIVAGTDATQSGLGLAFASLGASYPVGSRPANRGGH